MVAVKGIQVSFYRFSLLTDSTVIRAQNVVPQSRKKYYVKCTVDGNSEKTKLAGNGSTVEWNQTLAL